jgi:PPOX class probable FMN-dependent enzyme
MTERTAPDHRIRDKAALAALYDRPHEASIVKEVAFLHPHYQALIRAARLLVLATAGSDGLDASPRGEAQNLVEIVDEHTLHLPDRRGNNRTDSLRNVLDDPRVALLFLIPGVDETLRVNGRAEITVDPELLARYALDGVRPRSVLVIRVETVYFQCSKALARAHVWAPARYVERKALPSSGAMLDALREAGGGMDQGTRS